MILLLLLYNIIWALFLLFMVPYYLVTGKINVLKNRLGFFSLADEEHIWVHAASVGEVKIAKKFILELRKKTMQPIIFTVVTKTGYELAQKDLPHAVYARFAVFDFLPLVIGMLNRYSIEKTILVETELWPSYLAGSAVEDIPIYIINARISDKSYAKYLRFRYLFKGLLKYVTLVCAQTKSDKKRFIELGARSISTIVIPNIKYDLLDIAGDIDHIKEDIFRKRMVFVAGSTRSGEESDVLDAFIAARDSISGLMLVIAPRHLENVDKIKDLAKAKGLSYFLLSEVSDAKAKDIKSDILIVDVMGELVRMYKNADIVFVGGSLVDKGGQNIIEPATLGKLVVFGPYMNNFKEISVKFLEIKGAIQVKDKAELTEVLIRLLTHKGQKFEMVHRTLKLLKKMRGSAKQTAEHIIN